MTGLITLISKTTGAPAAGLAVRSAFPEDSEALARLYFASYDNRVSSQQEAKAKIDEIFRGAHGIFYPEASPVLVDEHDRVIAAALCLRNRQDGVEPAELPTIYELFTAASRRREGLAEKLIRHSIGVMADDGFEQVTVRVEENNYAALALYLTLDFNRWIPASDDLL